MLPRTRTNPKWIRGSVAGHTIIDTRDALFVWEHEYYPQWYVPVGDVAGQLVPNGATFDSAGRGFGVRVDLHIGDHVINDVGWQHPDIAELADRVRFEWDAIDAWYEENTEVFVHPRSPEVRIDALPSSRHVRVLIDDVVLADSVRPTILFEATLPSRYYLPQADVRMDLLTPTDTTSACPYKGFAYYWSVRLPDAVHADVAWGYRTPLPESEAVAGLICFYNEQVDIEVDGVRLEQPVTKFST